MNVFESFAARVSFDVYIKSAGWMFESGEKKGEKNESFYRSGVSSVSLSRYGAVEVIENVKSLVGS